ncbi:MAG: hypothetical protein AB1642_11275 [Pseudomonadota bacterium]
MNEADVREDVIAPLIKQLGYRIGTEFNIVREQGLRYEHLYLGRKVPERDPILRGKADYILEVRERVRWVIEAKAPSVELGPNDIEQAWSYANHPEVRAVYFVLCNGQRLIIYSTNQGPNAPALLDVAYSEFATRLADIVNLLGPAAIERDFPNLAPNASPPIGPGLRSIIRVTSGVIRYLKSTQPDNPALLRMQTFITSGSVERVDNRLVAYLKTHAPIREMQELNEQLGYDGFEMTSTDSVVSVDPGRPTTFISDRVVILPKGTVVTNLNTWQRAPMPFEITAHTITRAIGTLNGNTFSGAFMMEMKFQPQLTPPITLDGDFSIHVI